MILKKITVKISPNQIFTIFVLEMGDKFNKFILEGWKCIYWMAIDNTNNNTTQQNFFYVEVGMFSG